MVEKRIWQREALFKTAIVWLAIILLATYWLTLRGLNEPVSISVMPETPRKGEPILVTMKLNNPDLAKVATKYSFYAGGKLIKEGETTISPLSGKTYQYSFNSPVDIGERVSFAVKTSSDQGSSEKAVSIPPYPPQVCSSFISFASFSTSVMSSMSTNTYYKDNFAETSGVNAGLVISLCLIALLICMELAGAYVSEKVGSGGTVQLTGPVAAMTRFKSMFTSMTWILFIIFVSIVYTKIVMILTIS